MINYYEDAQISARIIQAVHLGKTLELTPSK